MENSSDDGAGRVDSINSITSAGLAAIGVERGDTVAMMLPNRPEFSVCDAAAMHLGATPFSIYQTYTPDQIAYVVSDSGAKVVITEMAYLPVVQAAREQLPDRGFDVAGFDRRKIRQRGICEQGIRHRARPAWVEERLF